MKQEPSTLGILGLFQKMRVYEFLTQWIYDLGQTAMLLAKIFEGPLQILIEF